jgi:hypothetical protein
MKIYIIICSLFFAPVASAKTVITLTKSSQYCSVSFKTSEVKRINGKKYLGLNISDIDLVGLHMSRHILETSVSSQWLNTGERYFVSVYVNGSIGPKHIPIEIPERSDDYSRYIDINIDEYLPEQCFGRQKIRFRDRFGQWWETTGEGTAKGIGEKTGKGAHKVWDALRGGAKNISNGWKNYEE